MIPQLVDRLTLYRSATDSGAPMSTEAATAMVLSADPFDLVLYAEQEWMNSGPSVPQPVKTARQRLVDTGVFHDLAVLEPGFGWNHLISSYLLENTRALQILKRVVLAFRTGESLGVPSLATQRWLDVSEAFLFSDPITGGALSPSLARPDAEAVRRNAYWRMFGMDLGFGDDQNRTSAYEKPAAANVEFIPNFERLLAELEQAMAPGPSEPARAARNETIYRLSVELGSMLRSRRQGGALAREELASATVLGWVNLTLGTNSAVVLDAGAEGATAADRLEKLGYRVGLSAHARSSAFFDVHEDLSRLLRILEAGIGDAHGARLLYETPTPEADPMSPWQPIGTTTRRIITEWAAATGRGLDNR
jgi:hypothetical protein